MLQSLTEPVLQSTSKAAIQDDSTTPNELSSPADKKVILSEDYCGVRDLVHNSSSMKTPPKVQSNAKDLPDLPKKEYTVHSPFYYRFKGTFTPDVADQELVRSYPRNPDDELMPRTFPFQFDLVPFTKKKSDCKKTYGYHSFTGGFKHRLSVSRINPDKPLGTRPHYGPRQPLYDWHLLYKLEMCKVVMEQCKSTDCEKHVIFANEYPCIILTFLAFKEAHEEELQRFFNFIVVGLMLSIVNYNAVSNKIPIEMVTRASFCHSLPSLDIAAKSVRISVGFVPREYAKILGQSIVQLYSLIKDRLEKKLTSFDKEENDLWQTLFAVKEAKKQPLIHELLVKEVDRIEVFLDIVMRTIFTQKDAFFTNKNWLRGPIKAMMAVFDKNSEEYAVNRDRLKDIFVNDFGSYSFSEVENKKLASDEPFWRLVHATIKGLGYEVPKDLRVGGLYYLMQNYSKDFLYDAVALDPTSDSDEVNINGSASEEEGVVDNDDKSYFYSKKIRMINGMVAISASYYASRLYLREKRLLDFDTKPGASIDYMYFEIIWCLDYMSVFSVLEKLERCNESNADELPALSEREVEIIKFAEDCWRKEVPVSKSKADEGEKNQMDTDGSILDKPLNKDILKRRLKPDSGFCKVLQERQNAYSDILFFSLNNFVMTKIVQDQNIGDVIDEIPAEFKPKIVILDTTSSTSSSTLR